MRRFQPDLSEILLLVPTRNELQEILVHPEILELVHRGLIARLCGFGQVASGLVTAMELQARNPKAVLLAGIAGGLLPGDGIGMAIEFSSVTLDGIGVGSGADHRSAMQLGWEPFQNPDFPIGEVIETGWPTSPGGRKRQLLSVCSASANDSERLAKTAKFPHAIAEDMEGYAVAAACQLAKVPIRIVRGISNLAGDRDHAGWKTGEALSAAAALAATIIRQSTIP